MNETLLKASTIKAFINAAKLFTDIEKNMVFGHLTCSVSRVHGELFLSFEMALSAIGQNFKYGYCFSETELCNTNFDFQSLADDITQGWNQTVRREIELTRSNRET